MAPTDEAAGRRLRTIAGVTLIVLTVAAAAGALSTSDQPVAQTSTLADDTTSTSASTTTSTTPTSTTASTTSTTSTTTTTVAPSPQSWSATEDCELSDDRPAHLTAVFQWANEPPWPFELAREAMVDAALDTTHLDRVRDRWSTAYTFVAGPLSGLLEGAEVLRSKRGPNGTPTFVSIACVGQPTLTGELTIGYDPDRIDIASLIQRLGSHEVEYGDELEFDFDYGRVRYAFVKTSDPTEVIQRAAIWLAQDEVTSVEPKDSRHTGGTGQAPSSP